MTLGSTRVDSAALIPIPQPRTLPVVGNLLEVDISGGILGVMDKVAEYGPIFRFRLPGTEMVMVASQQLVHELCDESRFDKKVHGALQGVRDFAGDGLFTAYTDELNWQKAHRILMPAFGPAALRDMFDGMLDITEQVLVKLERFGPEHDIDVSDEMTRLTLDTIALCSFSYRFNSMYSQGMHPFVTAMIDSLQAAQNRARGPKFLQALPFVSRRYEQDKDLMFGIVDDLIAHRRENPLPDGRKDILDTMLEAADPATGEKLDAENVRYQLVTFLIAGHETTSGLLTFALYELLRNPDVLARAQAHVDNVLGRRRPHFEDLAGLDYIDRILKETLRLWPTAPAFAVQPLEDTVIGGKYAVRKGETIMAVLPRLHRDPVVWGDTAESFDPDRFEFHRMAQLPQDSWKPFGNGQRSCIGRGFALQEANLFLAMLLQRFDIEHSTPGYELDIQQTLTIKPRGLRLRARRRDLTIIDSDTSSTTSPLATSEAAPTPTENAKPIRVLYGSNAGTSKAFAQRLATDAGLRGYRATVDTLDSAVDGLSGGGAVIIVSSSYEGLPPDNARAFVEWVQGLSDGALDGLRFAVFGNGNTDWAHTYQAVPTLIDEHLARAGGTRLIGRGEANARADFFGAFDSWSAEFWPVVAAEFGRRDDAPALAQLLDVEFVGSVRDPILRSHGLALGTVTENRELVDLSLPAARSKRHLEIALPDGSAYRAGDYLDVLPFNSPRAIDRVFDRFALAPDATVLIRVPEHAHTFLPVDEPISVTELMSGYVELSQPATRTQIARLAEHTVCPPEKNALSALASDPDKYAAEILAKRVSIIDLLERYRACGIGFAEYLNMLPPLTPRQYSISSSPLWKPDHAALTVSVFSGPSWSESGAFEGVGSTYLASLNPDSRVAITVRPSSSAFHPPESLDTPIIMVCAGTGIAPFRGFIQDRALRAEHEGTRPATALLFFGCRYPDGDELYRDELKAWADQGIVDVRPVYSRAPVDGMRYVQDRLWADRSAVVDLVRQGATVYVCGDGDRMAPAVRETCERIYSDSTGESPEDAKTWLAEMQHEHHRYVVDVFA